MKIFFIAIFSICLLAPVFAQQDANAPVYQSLNESMNATIAHGTETLENFDNLIRHNDQGKTYADYRIRYDALVRALQASEIRLGQLLRFNERPANVIAERSRYENLLSQIEAIQSEYSSWAGTVR